MWMSDEGSMIRMNTERRENDKYALAEITGPYRFMQLIYVVLQYPDYNWEVCVRYVDGSKESVDTLASLCRESGLFSKVYYTERSAMKASFTEKLKMLADPLAAVLTFRKRQYAERFIRKNVSNKKYRLFCAETSFSFLGGAMMNLADRVPTILLEDGSWDYVDVGMNIGFLEKAAGRFLFHAGVVNFIGRKNFSRNRFCLKYATRPDKLLEHNFRKVRKLFSNRKIYGEYQMILKRIYHIDELKNDDYDVIAFTTDSVSRPKGESGRRFIRFLENKYAGKRILLKKHPADTFEYESETLQMDVKYKQIAGELLLSVLPDAEIVFMYPSSILMSVPEDRKMCVVHFDPKIMDPEYQKAFDEITELCSVGSELIEEG